jgi:cysteine desulfurase
VRRVAPRALIHTDAVQAAGKVLIKAEKWGVDLLSVSGHKLHAPKGIGALYIRKGVRVLPRQLGGGQENGLRSGTEPVPTIVGFGAAAAAVPAFSAQNELYTRLRAQLMAALADLPEVRFHLPQNGVPYVVNLSVVGFRSETLLHFLAARDIFVSSGSACAKGKQSGVLTAMGLSAEEIDSSLRISFCRDTCEADVSALCDALHEATRTLQRRQNA